MLGNRDELEESVDVRLQIESLRYLQQNEPETFKEAKSRLEGTELWNIFQREYGG